MDKYYSQCQELMVLIKLDCSWEFKDDTIIWYKEKDVLNDAVIQSIKHGKELEKKDNKIERLEEIVEAQKEIIKAKDVILKGVVY